MKENLIYLVPLIACGLLNAFGIYLVIETILRQDYVWAFFTLLCEGFILLQTYRVVKTIGKIRERKGRERPTTKKDTK